MQQETTQGQQEIYPLLRRFGWNSTAYQIVNPGIQHWISPERDAVIGYVTHNGIRVVAGAPVCAEGRLAEVTQAFAHAAAQHGEKVCYFGAAGRLFSLLSEQRGTAVVVLGAQPVWNPQHWPERRSLRPSLRAQLARAENKGVVVREWSVTQAQDHPELSRVLAEWLAHKPLPSMHFLVEPQTLSCLTDKRLFVAERGGTPVGFVNLAPIPTRNGWLTEQFVRGKDAPNGTVERMLDTAMHTVASEGATYFTMGLVPLSSGTWDPALYNPLWLRFILGWVRAHGNRFYNFAGLEAFKAKFGPSHWEPIYAISSEVRFSPQTLYAIAAAFSDRSPLSMVTRGGLKALRQEWRWLTKGL